MKLPVNYNDIHYTTRKLVREEYIRRQKGLCYYCNSSITQKPPKEILNKSINWRLFPKNFLKYPIHLHHNHNTGMTIGAVHNYCNAVLWQYFRE